jgi:LemA protein
VKLTKPAIVTGIVLGVLFLLGAWFVANYNSLVSASNAVDNSWAKVETQYQRRLDLIDNVLQSVKGSQGQEQEVFGKIADARSQYNNASTTEEKAAAASSIETNVAVIPRLQEAYPELKSNEQVTALVNELKTTENGIAEKRDFYNDTVTNYNNNITKFPKSIFAGMYGYEKAKLFKAEVSASKAPKVNFNE